MTTAIEKLIEAAHVEARRLNELARTSDDRGAAVIEQQAATWRKLANNAAQELQDRDR